MTPPALFPRLLLVRHAESIWNEEGRLQGQLDPPLSELGRWQASKLAHRLSQRRPVALYTSDLERCLQTASILAGELDLEPQPSPTLREINLGEWQGLARSEVARRYPELWERWLTSPTWDLVPGGEGATKFASRVTSALAKISQRHAGADEVVVVTHGGLINMALATILRLPVADHAPFRLANTSITILEHRGDQPVVSLVNDICHLDPGCP